MEAKSGITVIIPAYNEIGLVGKTLRSLRRQSLPPDAVVVTDDFSSDGTGRYVEALFPEVTVIRPYWNLGSKAKAQNFALFYRQKDGSFLIKTPLVVTIDADTWLDPKALEKLSEPLRRDSRIKASCGTVIPANPDNPYTLGRLGEYFYAFAFPKRLQQFFGGNIHIVSGCFSCYDTNTLRKRWGWHTTTMAEDMDLTADYHRLGYKVAFVHEAVCFPVEPYNWETYSAQLKRWSAAFFQNISLHWRVYRSRWVGVFVLVAFLDAGVGGILYLLTPLWMYLLGLREWIFWFLVGDVLLISVPVLWMGSKLKMTKLAVKSIPFIFFLRLLNTWFWFRAMWLEWIKKEHLSQYVKGH